VDGLGSVVVVGVAEVEGVVVESFEDVVVDAAGVELDEFDAAAVELDAAGTSDGSSNLTGLYSLASFKVWRRTQSR
jgi:hypothetical protein